MKLDHIVDTIDLWTEGHDNHQECFDGAFTDGFSSGLPFDSYKVVKNCNCIIKVKPSKFNVANKHNAIVFYKDGVPVRLVVINEKTNVDECIKNALKQDINGMNLEDIFKENNIEETVIDMHEEPIHKDNDMKKETDTGSSDRMSLLRSMLKGSYTEEDGDSPNKGETFRYIPEEVDVRYLLVTDSEFFDISHKHAFTNSDGTVLIPLQEKSSIFIKK